MLCAAHFLPEAEYLETTLLVFGLAAVVGAAAIAAALACAAWKNDKDMASLLSLPDSWQAPAAALALSLS